MTNPMTLETLANAVTGSAAALRSRTILQPAAGEGTEAPSWARSSPPKGRSGWNSPSPGRRRCTARRSIRSESFHEWAVEALRLDWRPAGRRRAGRFRTWSVACEE